MQFKGTRSALFIGLLLSAELKGLLWNNKGWERLQIERASQGRALKKAPYQKQEFLGHPLENGVSLEEILSSGQEIALAVRSCCPEADEGMLKLYLFSQALIS